MKLYIPLLFIFLLTACPQPNRETIIDNSARPPASVAPSRTLQSAQPTPEKTKAATPEKK